MAEKDNKIYLTTPIYYVNSKPHIGHAYATLAVDVLARYYKNLGKDVFFLTGTDEHGAKIAEASQKAGKNPQEFCDEISGLFKTSWQNLNIDYSYFIRTTDKNHEGKVVEFLNVLKSNGYLYEGQYAGNYCVGCEKFVTDKDLVDGKCPDHKCEPQEVAEENWFFKLRQLLPKIQELVESDKILIRPENAKSEVLGVIKQGIDDVSISRKSVSWGIKLPWEESQTIYVWVDALLNYWTALQNLGKTEFWPADLHLVGRDILKFHCIMWPAILLAYYGEDAIDQLPGQIFCHGYFTIDGQKMSKTIGNVVDPNDLIKKYGVDATRYLLLTQFPFGNDGDVSLLRLDEKYNSDLASGLGNLVARVVTLAEKLKIKNEKRKTTIKNEKLEKTILEAKEKYKSSLALENLKIDEALMAVWELIGACDKVMATEKPWELANEKLKTKNEKVIGDLLVALREIAELLRPFMPQTAEKIIAQIKTGKSDPLFPRLINMLIDTHAHLDVEQYDNDREQVIKNAKENGIGFIINPSFDLQSAKRAIALASKYENIFSAIGCHPKTKEESGYEFNKNDYLSLVGQAKVVAIGECGLEGGEDGQYQEKVFKEQIGLAKEFNLPIIIHCRNAHKRVIEILSEQKDLNGVIHCFSGSWSDAQKYLAMGFYVSFTGIITYANDYDKVVKNTPLDRILIETDCPYLSPVPLKRQRNEPANVRYVAQRIAEIRGESLKAIAQATTQNAKNLFKLSYE